MWACIYGNYLPRYVIKVPRRPCLSNHPSHFMSTKFLLIKKICTYTMYGNSFPLHVKALEALRVYSIQKNIYVFCIHFDQHRSTWQLISTRCVKNKIISHICSVICTHTCCNWYIVFFFPFLQLWKSYNLPTTIFHKFSFSFTPYN